MNRFRNLAYENPTTQTSINAANNGGTIQCPGDLDGYVTPLEIVLEIFKASGKSTGLVENESMSCPFIERKEYNVPGSTKHLGNDRKGWSDERRERR